MKSSGESIIMNDETYIYSFSTNPLKQISALKLNPTKIYFYDNNLIFCIDWKNALIYQVSYDSTTKEIVLN